MARGPERDRGRRDHAAELEHGTPPEAHHWMSIADRRVARERNVATPPRQEYSIAVRVLSFGRHARLRATLALVAASTVGACGSDTPAPAPTSFTVWAFEERTGPNAPDVPLVGADVAFDPPGGGARLIARTAADGHVTFDGVDDRASGGGAGGVGAGGSVSVYDASHVLVTAIDASPETARLRPNTIGKPASDLVLFAPSREDVILRGSVALRGTFASKRDAANTVDVSVSGLGRFGSQESKGTTYELRAPRARAFFLLGHEVKPLSLDPSKPENEIVGSFRVDFPALVGDTTRDIDVAVGRLPLRTVRLRAELPAGPRSPFGAGSRGFATVQSADSELLVAPVKSARPSADGRAIDLEMSVATTEIAPERPITRALLVAPNGSRSVRFEPGVVADATTWSDFITPALVAAPPSPPPLSVRLPLDDFPPGADLLVEIYAGKELVWVITGPPGGLRGPVTLPVPLELRLPALVAVSISARMDPVPLNGGGEIYRRIATSPDVLYRR